MLEEYVAIDQYNLKDENNEIDMIKVSAMIQAKYQKYLRGSE